MCEMACTLIRMRMWRKAVAIWTSLTLLLLIAQAGGVVCRMAPNAAPSVVEAASLPGVHEAHQHSGTSTPSHHESPARDGMPNAQHPCTLISTCTVALSLPATLPLSVAWVAPVSTTDLAAQQWSSVDRAPDRPPPRA